MHAQGAATACFGVSRKKISDTIDEVVTYFDQLQYTPYSAHNFFEYWDLLDQIPVGQLSTVQCDIILKNTAYAYDAEDSALKGSDFRLRLRREIDKWTKHAVHLMPIMDARHAATYSSYFAKLGIDADQRYNNFWHAKTFSLLDHASPQYLTMIGMATAGLGERPETKFLKKWARNVILNKSKFSMRDCINVVWTLAVWDSLCDQPTPFFRDMAAAFTAQINDISIKQPPVVWEEQNLYQIRDACLWFGLPNPCPQPLGRNNTSSSLEKTALNEFAEAHMPVLGTNANRIAKLNKLTDIAVSTGHGQVNIEMDGHRHFVFDGGERSTRLNGRTEFQTGLMCKVEPHLVLVRVPDRTLKEAQSLFNGHCGERMFSVFDQAAQYARDNAGHAFMLQVKGNSLHLKGLHA